MCQQLGRTEASRDKCCRSLSLYRSPCTIQIRSVRFRCTYVFFLSTLWCLVLFGAGNRFPLCFAVLALIPSTAFIKCYRHYHRNRPAYRPSEPDPDCSEKSRQNLCENYTEDKVGESRCHKLLHHSCAPEDSICGELCRNNGSRKVKVCGVSQRQLSSQVRRGCRGRYN